MSYCELLQIDLSWFSEDVRETMEEEMKKNITDKVLEVHPYRLPTKTEYEEKGRCKTHVKDASKKEGRRIIWATSEEEMIEKLFVHYFGKEKSMSFEAAFKRASVHYVEHGKVRQKTMTDYIHDFNRFFKEDAFSKKPISDISISDMARFLDRAHMRVSKKDTERGQKVIEKHRHNAIRTIINLTYSYVNTYEALNAPNPLVNLDYARFNYYDQDTLDKDWYDEEDRERIGRAFDRLPLPNLEDLCAGFLIETAGRNSECRSMRFSDFHFDTDIPYVRICGMAENSHRDERIKADSTAGMRNLAMTPRLEKIYKMAKLLSWSDEYLFVRDPKKVAGTEILVTSQGLQRGLKRLCEEAGVKYLPPHQIRFSDATLLAIEGRGAEIQKRLGHTTSRMSEHYIRKAGRMTPVAGPSCTQSSQGIEKAPTTRAGAFSTECPEPESNQ